jgi:hypothetical protein
MEVIMKIKLFLALTLLSTLMCPKLSVTMGTQPASLGQPAAMTVAPFMQAPAQPMPMVMPMPLTPILYQPGFMHAQPMVAPSPQQIAQAMLLAQAQQQLMIAQAQQQSQMTLALLAQQQAHMAQQAAQQNSALALLALTAQQDVAMHGSNNGKRKADEQPIVQAGSSSATIASTIPSKRQKTEEMAPFAAASSSTHEISAGIGQTDAKEHAELKSAFENASE